jgi:hypothetical protein
MLKIADELFWRIVREGGIFDDSDSSALTPARMLTQGGSTEP